MNNDNNCLWQQLLVVKIFWTKLHSFANTLKNRPRTRLIIVGDAFDIDSR